MTKGMEIAEKWLISTTRQAALIDTAITDAVKQEREECAKIVESCSGHLDADANWAIARVVELLQKKIRSRNQPPKLCNCNLPEITCSRCGKPTKLHTQWP